MEKAGRILKQLDWKQEDRKCPRCGKTVPMWANMPADACCRACEQIMAHQGRVSELRVSHVPPDYRDAALGPHEADIATAYQRDGRPMIYVYGKTGVGKTRLCWAAWMWWAGMMPTLPRYETCAALLPDLAAAKFARGEKDYAHSIKRLENWPGLLILDDLASDSMSAQNMETLYRIVDARVMFTRPLLCAGNLTLPEIGRQDRRLASRLGCGTALPLTGPDRRLERK